MSLMDASSSHRSAYEYTGRRPLYSSTNSSELSATVSFAVTGAPLVVASFRPALIRRRWPRWNLSKVPPMYTCISESVQGFEVAENALRRESDVQGSIVVFLCCASDVVVI